MSANIPLNNILIGQTAFIWQEAIQIATVPFTTNKSITEEYVHQMIKSVDKLGSYAVLMPGFALAHISPGNSVPHTDISIAAFREPVDFHSENGSVSVVMCLACIDRTSYIERLRIIAEELMESNDIDKIATYKNKEELLSLLRE